MYAKLTITRSPHFQCTVVGSMLQTISDYKWPLLIGGALAGAALYIGTSDAPVISLDHGKTMLTANSITGGDSKKQLRVASLIRSFRDMMDKDHSGEVDSSEFADHLRALGMDNKDLALCLFRAIDIDDGGSLSIEEFYTFLTKLEDGSTMEQIEIVFNIISGGQNKSSVSRSQCKKCVVALAGEARAEQLTRDIFRAAGGARRNTLSRDDFINNLSVDDSNTENIVVHLAQKVIENICCI